MFNRNEKNFLDCIDNYSNFSLYNCSDVNKLKCDGYTLNYDLCLEKTYPLATLFTLQHAI